jgi:hypothetical protein
MLFIDIRRWAYKSLTLSLLTALFTTCSMVALAASAKPVGELILPSGESTNGAAVTVNGEAATSGRTLFSLNTISTPDGIEAALNLGKAGRLRLDPNTTFILAGDGEPAIGELVAGSVTVLNAAQPVYVRTAAGELVRLNADETANAGSARAARDHRDSNGNCVDDDNDGKEECGSFPAWGWAALIGVVAVVAIVAVAAGSGGDNNNNNNVSPVS